LLCGCAIDLNSQLYLLYFTIFFFCAIHWEDKQYSLLHRWPYTYASCSFCPLQWYGPPTAKKIRAGQDYDLMTAIEDAVKFVEIKVEKTDNIALTLQHINERIVNQDKLWYHLRKADEPDVEDDSTDVSSSYHDYDENREDDLFVQTVRNLDPTEQKETPIQISVIVDPKKTNSLSLKGPIQNGCPPPNGVVSPTNQMFATYTPGMGMKYFMLPPGWNCYHVQNGNGLPSMLPNPSPLSRPNGSVSSRDSSSLDGRFSSQSSPLMTVPPSNTVSDMESDDQEYLCNKEPSPSPEPHEMRIDVTANTTQSWQTATVPIVQIESTGLSA
jgi:hypothetical protein